MMVMSVGQGSPLRKRLGTMAFLKENAIRNGTAWEKFRELAIAQGGDVSYMDVGVALCPHANANSPKQTTILDG